MHGRAQPLLLFQGNSDGALQTSEAPFGPLLCCVFDFRVERALQGRRRVFSKRLRATPSLFSLSPFPPTSPSLRPSLLTALIGRFTANSKLGGGEGRGEIGALKSGATGAEIKSFN